MTQKKAIGYARISTSDQSNFSLDGQEEYIRAYCERNAIMLCGLFRDDGESAQDFDRANWRALEGLVKQDHRQLDYIIVMKYDRFSRNLPEALMMMADLEKKYSITVVSVMEPIGLHPDSPYFFQMRTQMLLGADVELRVIRDRTKFGLVQGARSGRFLKCAPAGYVNARDDQNKPIIVQDPPRASLIREVYELYLQGMPLVDIAAAVRKKGLKLHGHCAMRRVLTNPVYAGLIKVSAYYDEPEKLVKGLHEAIIDPDTWWKVQDMLERKPGQRHASINPELPLRGVLSCSCGQRFTGDRNKGKSRYYWYYICFDEKLRYNADKLHQQFDAILDELSLPEHYLSYLQETLESGVKEQLMATEQRLTDVRAQLKQAVATEESLEEKYLLNTINTETYHRWKGRLSGERQALELQALELSGQLATPWQRYRLELTRLGNLRYLYTVADPGQKQAFIRIVFDNQLQYANGAYRTPFLMPLFASKAVVLKEKGLLYVEQPSEFSGNTPVREVGGNLIELTSKLLEWAASIKDAA